MAFSLGVFGASSPNTWNASTRRGRLIFLNRIDTGPTRRDACGSSSNSRPRPRAWRSGSLRTSCGISASRISRSRGSPVPSCSGSVGTRRSSVSRSTGSWPYRMWQMSTKRPCKHCRFDEAALIAVYRTFPPVGPRTTGNLIQRASGYRHQITGAPAWINPHFLNGVTLLGRSSSVVCDGIPTVCFSMIPLMYCNINSFQQASGVARPE